MIDSKEFSGMKIPCECTNTKRFPLTDIFLIRAIFWVDYTANRHTIFCKRAAVKTGNRPGVLVQLDGSRIVFLTCADGDEIWHCIATERGLVKPGQKYELGIARKKGWGEIYLDGFPRVKKRSFFLPEPELEGEIYVGGAVNNPGLYPLKAGDNIETILQAAGGTSSHADLSLLKLYVPEAGETDSSQKIDINRAESWLLEALPGIGEVLAQRIVDYRSENGPFRITEDLLKVNGIGDATLEQIKDYITVSG